jgi:hypothetical protein
MATVTNRVRIVLRDFPSSRSSDKELYLIYLQKSGMNLTEEQIKIFRDMPSLETISRVRRKVQENGEYLADSEVRNERLLKSRAMNIVAPLGKPERIEEVLA